MLTIEEKFKLMATDSAPGQEVRASGAVDGLIGEAIEGVRVDFSHGDVDAHPPIPGSIDLFDQGFAEGAVMAALMTENLTGVHEFRELFLK